VGSVASGRWTSREQDDMPVRRRAAKPPEPVAVDAPEVDLIEAAEDLAPADAVEEVRPAHPAAWLGGVLVEQG
jgi:hypothetical protein